MANREDFLYYYNFVLVPKAMKCHCPLIWNVATVPYVCYDKLWNGQRTISSGPVPILIFLLEKISGKLAQVMANISPLAANAKRVSMDPSANTRTSVPAMPIVASKGNVLTFREQLCHESNVSVISVGSDPAVTRDRPTKPRKWTCLPTRWNNCRLTIRCTGVWWKSKKKLKLYWKWTVQHGLVLAGDHDLRQRNVRISPWLEILGI